MPVWLLPLLLKYVFPAVITILQKTGAVNAAERLAIKVGLKVVDAVENTKVEYTYPTGKNGQTSESPVAQGPENGNFNKG